MLLNIGVNAIVRVVIFHFWCSVVESLKMIVLENCLHVHKTVRCQETVAEAKDMRFLIAKLIKNWV